MCCYHLIILIFELIEQSFFWLGKGISLLIFCSFMIDDDFSFLNSFEMVILDIQVTCPCFTLGTFAMLKCLCIVLIECTMNLGLGVNKVYVLISCYLQ
jgi:hypothetical protein